jgi:hypothetical protein
MRNLVLALLAAVVLLIAFAWSPWLSESLAKSLAESAFTTSWEHVIDGCGLDCKGCGARPARRVAFGYLVTLEYACGMIPADLPDYHQSAEAFVSSFGTVHGLPAP